MGLKAEEPPAPSYWIVIWPEPLIRRLWARWYQEKWVAVGWGPPDWSLEGQTKTDSPGWKFARKRLKEIRPGDKVIPFLREWRIGPVGTVVRKQVKDNE